MEIPTKNEIFLTQLGALQSSTGYTYRPENLPYPILQAISSTQQDLYRYTELKFQLNFWLSKLSLDELKIVGSNLNLPSLLGSNATGQVVILGTEGTNIQQQLTLVNNNNQYQTQAYGYITSNNVAIKSISRTATLATAYTAIPHNLGSGCTVTISAFTEINFNKTTIINVISDISFTYEVLAIGATSDVNGNANYSGCILSIQSTEVGFDKDLQNGSTLIFDPTITGVSGVFTNFYGVTGGTNVETQIEYYTRLIDNIINKLPKDSSSEIIKTINENFPSITKGKVISKYIKTLGITSIMKDPSLSNNYQRKVTCKTAHKLRDLTYFKSITGANSPSLNINDQITNNRGISKIYDSFSFVINVENTVSEDNSSVNMLINFSGFNSAIVLYKSKSDIKTLNANEIEAVTMFLINQVVSFENTADSFFVLSATEIIKSITIDIFPKITTLKQAVINNIYDYVLTQAEIGELIRKNAIDRIIENTVDDNNNYIQDFSTNMISDWTTSNETEILSLPKSNIILL